jgi:hypothetical protein
MGSSAREVVAALLPLALLACQREGPEPEKFGQVWSALPAWRTRTASGGPAHGALERRDGQGAIVSLAWDADDRRGPASEVEALVVAGLGPTASARPAIAVGAHPALEVAAGESRTLVWRCEKTRRLLRLSLNDKAAAKADAERLAAGIGCHSVADKPVNGEVPVADTALLGPGWRFARRQPASAAWLRDDAVLTLFAGQHAPGPRDPETAAKVAPAWVAAAGLQDAQVASVGWAPGPAKHQALRVVGRARLDGRPVRFTLFLWRCLPRGRSHAALVFTQEAAATAAGTPHDAALLAVRCHG